MIIPPEYNISATKVTGEIAFFWIIFYSLLTFFFLNLKIYNPYSGFQVVAWIFVGSAIGAISGMMYTKNQLRRLSKDHLIYPNGKDIILFIVPILILVLPSFFISWFVYGALIRGLALLGLLISVFAFGISEQVVKYLLFHVYEKKENMRLMQSLFESGIVVIPKAPNRSFTA